MVHSMPGPPRLTTDSVASEENPLRYAHTAELPGLLEHLDVSLWVTTYQAGKMIVLRSRADRLSMLPRTFNEAMGLAISRERIAVGTRAHVWFLENEPQFAAAFSTDHRGDACFLPRRAHVTGNLRGHEIAWDGTVGADDRRTNLWIVNTLFSCLCTLDDRYSFVPRWQPPFITELSGGDRCHLNGIAMRHGRPRYVTLLAATNEPAGWRQLKLTGGCVMDVTSNETILSGLCMPHSPRWHDGRLWLLNSGRGELLCINPVSGQADVVARFPGYPRGLALVNQVGFVGLSQVRETATFGGLPLTEGDSPLQCGVWAVDLRSGALLGRIEFLGAVAEIFDVQVLRGVRDPFVVGLEKETFEQTFVIPPTTRPPVTPARTGIPSRSVGSTTDPGTVLECRFLGRRGPFAYERCATDVYYVRYTAANDGGCCQAAKLHLPVGSPPASGWPVSIWCHGLGDPATQLRRWPLTPGDWRHTRGKLAGRWANMGIATLTPWMPGDGPSEPLGSYSPYALQRNGQALNDAFLALRQLAGHEGDIAQTAATSESRERPTANGFSLDLTRLVLRTDCVASSLLVYFAAQFSQRPHTAGLRAFVADDFQPGIAHSQGFLGPILDRLPARDAAAVRCIWMRVLWSLFVQQGFPLRELASAEAHELFSRLEPTPVGPLSRIYASRLVPPRSSDLVGPVVACLERTEKGAMDGAEISRWMFAPRMLHWTQTRSVEAVMQHEFYREYLAEADPFFAENITPFRSPTPLLVIGRAGPMPGHVAGLPDFDERFQHMTLPKLDTLRSWGWDVRVLRATADQGTSFGGGPAQQWTLQQLDGLL